MKRFNLLLIASLSFLSLYADAPVDDIDLLLSDIEKKSDLSEQTKLENSGISLIYTRNDLDRMQARYLKDVLSSSTTYGYRENRYSAPDPLTQGDLMPFVSCNIRVFIDNQEVLSGMYGSGIANFGDLDIGFADHVEIYTQAPTYEYSTEPTFMLIKVYSKSTLRDEGSKLELTYASYNAKKTTFYTAQELNDNWSYFAYFTYDDLKRQDHYSHSTKLSRDKKNTHIFATLSTDNQKIIVENVNFNKDSFAGTSLDATPLKSTIYVNNFHLGYDVDLNNFAFAAVFEQHRLSYDFLDDVNFVTSKQSYTVSDTFSTEVKYKYNDFYNNDLIVGAKYRYKLYHVDQTINGINMPPRKNDNQKVSTLFMQDAYSLRNNLILTAGIQYVNVKTEDSKYNKNDDILGYRAGVTYLKDSWTLKLIASHTETYLEPYLIDSNFVADKPLKKYIFDYFYETATYKVNNDKYEVLFGYMEVFNYLLPDKSNSGKLDNYDKTMYTRNLLFRWTHKYNRYDKFFLDTSYQDVTNTPELGTYRSYKVVVRNLNTYNKFDIFNEVIYDRDNITKKNYYNYNLGLKYRYSDSFSLSLKGENIFNKANESGYFRVDPNTYQKEEPLYISPYDRRYSFSMEYLF